MTNTTFNTQATFLFDVSEMREQVIQHLQSSNQLDAVTLNTLTSPDTWWLLGTQSCHLCENAQKTLQAFCRVYPIEFIDIDIIKLEASIMTQFAPYIPILLSSSKCLYGCFSVVDLQKLV